MKQNFPVASAHAKPITSRAEFDKFLEENYKTSQVKFSVLTEHRLFADKMFGWWDPMKGVGELYHDSFAPLNEGAAAPGDDDKGVKTPAVVTPPATDALNERVNEGEGKEKKIVQPIAKPATDRDEPGVAEAKTVMEKLDEGRADLALLTVLTEAID